jgi:hypothetical protein
VNVLARESGKITGQKKALCRYWALINIVSDQNNLFNSMPILVLPNKSKANITPYFKLIFDCNVIKHLYTFPLLGSKIFPELYSLPSL